MSTNLSHDLLLHRNQDELQEFLTDVQTLDNEGDYDDDPLFNFEQNLYGQALDLTEHEDDPWKELNAEDVPDISYEEIEEIEEVSSEYSEEIPATTQKPTTLCVIIDNDYGEIRRCNRISNKRLQELVGVWEIDANAVEEVNRQLHLLGVCSRHFNYDQNTVHRKNLKSERPTDRSQFNSRICFFCHKKKVFFSRGVSCLEHTWIVHNQTIQVPCRGMVLCPAIKNSTDTENTENSRGVRFVCCQCYEKNGGHLHVRHGSGNIVDMGCIAKHSDDITTALQRFAKLIEIVAESEDDNVKKHLLQVLNPCLKNFDLNSSPAQINKLPSLFVVNIAFKVKKLDFSKHLKQFTLKPKKCEEFGKSLALEILKSRASLSSHKEALESPESLQQYYEAMPKCLTSFFDGIVLTLQLKNHEIVKRKQEERKKKVTELDRSEIVKSTSFLSSVILAHAFRSWKFWLPQIVGSFCERPKLASYLRAILRAANVVAYSKDYEVKVRRNRMLETDARKRLKFGSNIWNLAVIDNIDFKEKTFRAGNIYDDTRDTAHATLRMVFQFEMPNIEIQPLNSNISADNLCGSNQFTEQWIIKLTQIFNQLIIEHPMEFGMSEINFALKEAVGKGCKVPPPNVVILEAGPAPSTNLAAHKACEMYIEDLELNQGESLDIACDEAIFRRLTDFSNSQLKLNPILGQWHTSKDMCSALIVAFSGYGLFGLASTLGTKYLEKLQDVVDYRATFRVLELIWAAVAIVVHMYMDKHCITLADIENGNNNILKVWTLYYKWASYLKLHKIGIRMGNFEVQHEHLKAFAPLFPITGKSRYAVSVPRFLMTVETNPTLKAKLQIVGSVNLTADEYFFAYDEALECFGVKFVKQNMTGRPTDLDNLKLVIKAAQNERDRLLALHAEFVTDNCISKTTNAEFDRKKALWKLVNTLTEAIECNEPEKHPLFEIANQLTPEGYERMFTCYNKGILRISDIIKQDILKVEKRIAKGRTKKDLVPLLLGKKATQGKKKRSMEDIS